MLHRDFISMYTETHPAKLVSETLKGNQSSYRPLKQSGPRFLLPIRAVEMHRKRHDDGYHQDVRAGSRQRRPYFANKRRLPNRSPDRGRIAGSFSLSEEIATSDTAETITCGNGSRGGGAFPLPAQSQQDSFFFAFGAAAERVPNPVMLLEK